MNELKISGAQLETLEHYVDRQREIQALLYYCEESACSVRSRSAVKIDGHELPISDDTRQMLLDFLIATKLELERQLREIPLIVRIGEEESDEEEDEDDVADCEIPAL